MASGYRKVFWGYFIVLFHLNLGPIMIFPPFIGYIMVTAGISRLLQSYDNMEFRYAKILVTIQAFISFIDIFGNIEALWQNKNQIYTILWLLMNAVLLITSYYFLLSGTIGYFKEVGDIQKEQEYTIDLRRILVITIMGQLCIIISSSFSFVDLYIISIIVAIFCSIYYLTVMNRLYKLFLSKEGNDLGI